MDFYTIRNRRSGLWLIKIILVSLGVLLMVIVIGKNGSSASAAPESQAVGGLSGDAQSMVDQVGEGLVSKSPLVRLSYPITFHILEASNFINAFVLPGGQVYVTRGLYDRLSTQGELAAILGHELGHIWMGNVEGSAEQNLGSPGFLSPSSPAGLQISREKELKADFLGMCFLSESGYDPLNMARMVEIFKQADAEDDPLPEAQRTHPEPDVRIQQVEQNLANLQSCPK